MRSFVRPRVGWLLVILFMIPILDLSAAYARGSDSNPETPRFRSTISREVSMFRILSVLEKKMEDPKLLKKMREKLFTLSDTQAQLIASLSDRMASGGNTAGTDIAFLLITVLIILS